MDDHPVDVNLGISRRTLLRRSAVVGGTLMWTAPTVQSLASPAFAQTGSPPPPPDDEVGKDPSYVAFCYTPTNSTETCCVKFDLTDDGGIEGSESGSFSTPGCSDLPDSDCGDPSLFTVTVLADGAVRVGFKSAGAGAFMTGSGFVKCGAPGNEASGGECVPGVVDGDTITFGPCGVSSI